MNQNGILISSSSMDQTTVIEKRYDDIINSNSPYSPFSIKTMDIDSLQDTIVEQVYNKYRNNGVILVLPVGSGKTRIAIEICRRIVLDGNYCYSYEKFRRLPGICLVMAPIHVFNQWKMEVNLMYPNVPVFIFHGMTWKEREKQINEMNLIEGPMFVLTSVQTLMSCNKFGSDAQNHKRMNNMTACNVSRLFFECIVSQASVMVIDELHIGTKTYDTMMQKFLSSLKCKKIGLTATPVMNRINEILPQINVIDPRYYENNKNTHDVMNFSDTMRNEIKNVKTQFIVHKKHFNFTKADRDVFPVYIQMNNFEREQYKGFVMTCNSILGKLQIAIRHDDKNEAAILRKKLQRFITITRVTNLCYLLEQFLTKRKNLRNMIKRQNKKEQHNTDEEDNKEDDNEDDKEDDNEDDNEDDKEDDNEDDMKGNDQKEEPITLENFKERETVLIQETVNNLRSSSTRFNEIIHFLCGIEEKQEKTLLFSEFPSFFCLLHAVLPNLLFIDGSMKRKEREKAINLWKSEANRYILCISTLAGGTGLNLPEAKNVVFLTMPLNPCIMEQAIGRTDRRNRTEGTIRVILLCSFLDTFSTRFSVLRLKKNDVDLINEDDNDVKTIDNTNDNTKSNTNDRIQSYNSYIGTLLISFGIEEKYNEMCSKITKIEQEQGSMEEKKSLFKEIEKEEENFVLTVSYKKEMNKKMMEVNKKEKMLKKEQKEKEKMLKKEQKKKNKRNLMEKFEDKTSAKKRKLD